jgi:trimeric autotransporter adhesin
MRRPLSWSAAVVAVVCVTLAGIGASGTAGAAVTGPVAAAARAGVITTVAGGVGGPAAGRKVAVNQPCGLASGRRSVYVTESAGDVVRRLDPASGLLSTVAGSGPTGLHGLNNPCGVAVDAAGNLIVANTGNNVLRVIAARSGVFYGKKMRAGRSYAIGRGSFSAPEAVTVDRHGNLLVTSQTGFTNVDDTASAVVSVLAGARGSFYGQQMVPGHVYPLAGQDCPGAGNPGCTPGLTGDGGPALAATFGTDLWGVTPDRSGNVVIADTDDGRIRVVAERSGMFYGQAMTAGDIYSVAGGGTGGLGDGGPASQATLSSPQGVAFDSAGNVVLSDSGDGRVRVVAAATGAFYGQQMTGGDIYTIAGGGTGGLGDGGPAGQGTLSSPQGVAFDRAGDVVIADTGDLRVRVVAAATGRFYGQKMTAGHIYTIAGNGQASYSGDGGLPTRAQLSAPSGLAVGLGGFIVVGDTGSNRVRVIAGRTGVFYGMKMTARHIYTVAGTGAYGNSGDGGPGTSAELANPGGVAVDHAGNILVSEVGSRTRVIANRTGRFYGRQMTAGYIYTLAGGGFGLAVDRYGNLLMATFGPVRVVAGRTGTFYGQRMTAGHLYTLRPKPCCRGELPLAIAVAVDHAGNVIVVGVPTPINPVLGIIAVKAGRFYGREMKPHHYYPLITGRLESPSAVTVDAAGNLLIADSGNNAVKVLAERSGTFYGVKMRAGHLYRVAGNGIPDPHGNIGQYSGDGGPATKARLFAPCGIAAYGKNLLVLDCHNNRVREVSG